MGKRSEALLLLEPVENAALMFEEKLDGADPTGTSTITNELLKMLTGSIRVLSEEMRSDNALPLNAGQKLTRMADELASMAKGLNLDGYYDAASEAQKFLMLVIYFREQLANNALDKFSWRELMAWKPPPEDEDEKARRDRQA